MSPRFTRRSSAARIYSCPMTVIVLHGGIAAGKSTIGRRLEELGAMRIDADQLARDAVAPGSPALLRVRERFGEEMFAPDGSLDRAALGQRVFGDSDALADLNAIVHPEVRRIYAERVARAMEADPDAIVVYEIPLFAETTEEQRPTADLVILAEAPAEQRVSRLVELRGMAEDDAWRRVASQADDAERRALSDVVIDTGGAEAETIARVDELWEGLTRGRTRRTS